MSSIIDLAYTKTFLLELLNTPSPSGNTDSAIDLVETAFRDLEIQTQRTVKGALLATIPGQSDKPAIALSGHVDTLGGMVREIRSNGRLGITNVGGYYPGSVTGTYCLIETESGQKIPGTVLLEKQSVHIHSIEKVHETAAELKNLEVRVDARTCSQAETEALGIQIGDFISWDAGAQVTETGFIKSRHLDDKAGVATMLAAAHAIKRHNIGLSQTTYFYISTYEEVGHGGSSGIPPEVEELLVVDMGVVGKGQSSDEYGVQMHL